jgi:exodeoxyribonuclease VII small subunit
MGIMGTIMATKENFEDALKRLEEIVRELEKGEIGIEEALKLFEEGTSLSKICASKLSNVEKRVEILKKGEKGNEVLELFQELDEG